MTRRCGKVFDAADAHSLLAPGVASRQAFHQLRDRVARLIHHAVQSMAELAGAAEPRSLHGLQHHAGARGQLLPDVRRPTQGRSKKCASPLLDALGSTVRYIGAAGEAAKVKALVNMVMNINTAGLAEGPGARRRRSGWT